MKISNNWGHIRAELHGEAAKSRRMKIWIAEYSIR
jgi:hypothetical protein